MADCEISTDIIFILQTWPKVFHGTVHETKKARLAVLMSLPQIIIVTCRIKVSFKQRRMVATPVDPAPKSLHWSVTFRQFLTGSVGSILGMSSSVAKKLSDVTR